MLFRSEIGQREQAGRAGIVLEESIAEAIHFIGVNLAVLGVACAGVDGESLAHLFGQFVTLLGEGRVGERIVKVKSRERGAAWGAFIVARGVGRILLIALFAYVIFTCSVHGLMGFLAGLAMPVIAMMCEAVYEFVASNRRSS